MRNRWQTQALIVWGVVTFLVGTLVTSAVVIVGGDPLPFDTWVNTTTTTWSANVDWLVTASAQIGKFTNPPFSAAFGVIVVLVLLITRQWRPAFYLATTAIAGVIVAEILKRLVARPRPPGAAEYVSDLEKSFPSGHAMVGLYIYLATGILLILYGRKAANTWPTALGWILAVAGVCLGITRIIIGVHWASDVLAGWAFGSCVVLLATAFWRPDDAILGVPEGPEDESEPPTQDEAAL